MRHATPFMVLQHLWRTKLRRTNYVSLLYIRFVVCVTKTIAFYWLGISIHGRPGRHIRISFLHKNGYSQPSLLSLIPRDHSTNDPDVPESENRLYPGRSLSLSPLSLFPSVQELSFHSSEKKSARKVRQRDKQTYTHRIFYGKCIIFIVCSRGRLSFPDPAIAAFSRTMGDNQPREREKMLSIIILSKKEKSAFAAVYTGTVR